MIRYLLITLIFWFGFNNLFAQITLTHNVGNTPIATGMPNCEYEENWARTFTLSEFGITTSEQFIIRSGKVAISNAYNGAGISFGVFAIDDSSFPDPYQRYLGGGRTTAPEIGDTPEIVNIDFVHPIVVTEEVERILVVVTQSSDHYNPDYKEALIAGTEQDNDISWFMGCREYYDYTPTTELNNPVPNANFFINVTGEIFNKNSFGANTTLTHNICDKPVWVNQYGCTGGGINFSRRFVMDDFGVSNNEEFIIYNGQAAFSAVGAYDVRVRINIYRIDSNFPASFSDLDLLGSSETLSLPYSSDRYNPKVFNFNFETPVVVPNDIEAILVEVKHFASPGYSASFIAGTEQDNDVSWIKADASGCTPLGVYEPVNISYYINVTGNVNHVTNNFEMNISNICSEFLKEFSLGNDGNVASVVWDFGDPASGTENTSTDLSPFHDFSSDGTYTITAIVTGNDNSVEVLSETIDVKEPPNAYGINNIYACEDILGSGLSTSFDVSNVYQQVIGNQTNNVVTFIDGSGNTYNVLPSLFSNSIKDRETITVRVARNDELCCYSEITFDLIVNPMPDLTIAQDINECDDDNDGFTMFDLSQIEADILTNTPNATVEFYHNDGTQTASLSIENKVENQEQITLRVTDLDTDCYNETTFNLIVNPLPVANSLPEIIGCDDNEDGISEYFDTSQVESSVLGNQMGMQVSYYNSLGNLLQSPLPNPYTNITENEETITLRVTNPDTNCYSETDLVLKTANKPLINTPATKFTCDLGDGLGHFDLSGLKEEIIGNQNNLDVYYFDDAGNEITNLISSDFQNTQPWTQTINIKVENAFSDLCVSETSFNLIVNTLPQLQLENSYFLCNLEPNLPLSFSDNFDTWEWRDPSNNVISNNSSVELTQAGNHQLIIGRTENGILCENTYSFELIRSILPSITEVNYQELSDNNYIEVIASGDGEFEYSIDGLVFQNNNIFKNVLGGIYQVTVRDRLGCGEDVKEVIIIDYPKFFTPNDDGYNDFWQIRGLRDYPNAEIYIYDRYGKFLKQLNPFNKGWDGTCNGEMLPSTDYWFTVKLDEKKEFVGHFTLKR